MATFLPSYIPTLNRLAELTVELGALSDGLNVRIRGIEVEIRATGAKVRAEFPIEPGVRLVWGRPNDTWELGIHWVEEKQTESLVKVARDLRLKALELVPELLSELVKQTQKMIDQVKAAGAAPGENNKRGSP